MWRINLVKMRDECVSGGEGGYARDGVRRVEGQSTLHYWSRLFQHRMSGRGVAVAAVRGECVTCERREEGGS